MKSAILSEKFLIFELNISGIGYYDPWYYRLTHLSRMYFRIFIDETRPFPILGLLGGIFLIFYSLFKRDFCMQTVENLIRRRVFAASDLVLHYLPMSHKKDSRLIWVKELSTINHVTY